MSSTRRRWVAAGASVAALLPASIAVAAIQQTYKQTFTTKHPGQKAGMSFTASQPQTGAVSADTVTITFPKGTTINPKAVPQCRKATACPANSKVGSGTAIVVGQKNHVDAYNRTGGLVIVVTPALPIVPKQYLTPNLKGTTLSLKIKQVEYPPGNPLTLSALTLNINAKGTAKKPYMRTPTKCPTGGWQFKAAFGYVDGTSLTKTSASPCVKH
jgi:hypothetical protein